MNRQPRIYAPVCMKRLYIYIYICLYIYIHIYIASKYNNQIETIESKYHQLGVNIVKPNGEVIYKIIWAYEILQMI